MPLSLSRPTFLATGLTVLGVGLCIIVFSASIWFSYLLFHTLVEFISIVIAFLIFSLVWNTRRMLDNHYLLFLGLSFLFSGSLVLAHTLAYQGMEVFPGQSADLSTQMWIAFRYVFSISFLLAPFFITRKPAIAKVLTAYGAVTVVLVGMIILRTFPTCYRDGLGMTPFKIYSEYAVSLVLTAALGLLILKRDAFDRGIFYLLSGSVAASVLSVLSYTQHATMMSDGSMVGHFFELIANYLIYRAVVVAGIVDPTSILFRNLKQSETRLRDSEERYRSLVELSPDAIVVHSEGVYRYVNPAGVKLFGAASADELIGRKVLDLTPPGHREIVAMRSIRVLEGNVIPLTESLVLRIDGRPVDIEMTETRTSFEGRPAVQAFIRDITERKQREEMLRIKDSAIATSINGIAFSDLQGNLTYVNQAFLAMWGYDQADEIIGRSARDFWHSREQAQKIVDELARTGVWYGEMAAVKRTGAVFFIQLSANMVRNEKFEPVCMMASFNDITERKQTERKIEHLASFPQLNPNPVLEMDSQGHVSFYNEAANKALQDLGLPGAVDRFLPGDLKDLLTAQTLGGAQTLYREVRIQNRVFAEHIHISGAMNVARIYAIDITTRRDAEAAQQTSETRYRLLFENMAEGFALYELLYDDHGRPADWRVLEVNDAYTQHTGIARDRIVGRCMSEMFPAAISEYLPQFAEVVATQTSREFETYAQAVDRYQHIVCFSAGRNRFANTITDITGRKRAELALQRANDKLETQVQERTRDLRQAVISLQEQVLERALAENELKHSSKKLENTLESIRVLNALLQQLTQKSMRKEYLDTAVALIRAWSGCRSAGIRMADEAGCIPYAASEGFSDAFLRSENLLMIGADQCACTRVIGGTPEPQDLPFLTPSGSFYVNDTMQLLNGLNKEQRGRYRGVCMRSGFLSLAVIPIKNREKVLGAIHLADEQKNRVPFERVEVVEQMAMIIGEALMRFEVEEERARLSSAVESAADAVVITDPASGVIQYANHAFELMTGYTREETLGRTLHFLESGRQGEDYYKGLREALARDDVWNGRLMNRKKSGSLYFEECTVSPVRDRNREIINYVYLKRDVTEKLRLESIAESVSTMDNIGYVFSGVRHEIGNPINSINMILGILRAKLESLPPEAVKDYLGRMTEQIGRVEYILRSLKSFNLYETQEPQTFLVASFMENFLPLITDDFSKKNIVIETTIEPGVKASADPRALQQVLLNIVTNAADALNGVRDPKITITVLRSGSMISLRIQDNGCGIPEEKLKNIFKPFYTTKTNGTGLGLVIVKKMIANMNGTIGIESSQDTGTIVNIAIPEGTDEE